MARKTKKIIGIVVIGALLCGGYYLYNNANRLIVQTTERIASKALGVKVDIGAIHLSLAQKRVTISGLKVANPPGYTDKHIITTDDIVIGLDTASRELIDFKNIDVTNSKVYFEMTTQGSNLNDLKKLANRKEQKESAGSKAIRVIVRQMVVDSSVIYPRISFIKTDIPPIHMPAVHISNIGQKNVGTNANEVIVRVMTQYLGSVQQAVSQSGVLKQVPNLDGAKKTWDDATGKLKSLF
jgi:hypothetical protein